MHHDYLRSAVHSSLTKGISTCHGNGTCQYGSIRRWRAHSPDVVNPKVGLDATLAGEEEARCMEYQARTELQWHLSHVCRGAQKLTHMIGSPSFEYFPEDLLRGALDLQESLVMLTRLQEASKVMSESRGKHKQGLREGSGVDDTSHKRSAINCSKELKNLIRDSFHRQNHLVSYDVETTSLSQSFNSGGSCIVEDSRYEQEQSENASSPNLIAKLMGLKEASARIIQPIEKEGKKKRTNPVRPKFNTIMPKVTKQPLTELKRDQPNKSLNGTSQRQRLKVALNCSDTPHREKFEKNAHKDDIFPPIHSAKLVQEKKTSNPTTLEIKEVPKTEKVIVDSSERNTTGIVVFNTEQKKDVTGRGKKPNVVRKIATKSKKREDKREKKEVRAPISLAKAASAREAKPDKRLKNSDAFYQRTTPTVHNLKCLVRPVSPNSIISAREKKTSGAKPLRKPSPSRTINKIRKFDDVTPSDPLCAMHDVSTSTLVDANILDPLCAMHDVSTSTLVDANILEPAEKEQNPFKEDSDSTHQKILYEVMPPTIDPNSITPVDKTIDKITKESGGEKSESAEESDQLPDKEINTRKPDDTVDVKQLLLSNQSFLSLAQGLFGLDAHQPKYYQRKGLEEIEFRNKLLLDCGKELLAHKSHQQELLKHPLMIQSQVCAQTLYVSLDQLVDEISDWIGKLVSYIVVDYDGNPEDSLYVRLERELGCKEMSMDIVWDVGWRNQICVEESDRIVGAVEEHILDLLVEEIVSDLVA